MSIWIILLNGDFILLITDRFHRWRAIPISIQGCSVFLSPGLYGCSRYILVHFCL